MVRDSGEDVPVDTLKLAAIRIRVQMKRTEGNQTVGITLYAGVLDEV
ncbi:hypothetical protein ACFQDF_03035 [Ectobacillus funiculus]|uniref:Uncharacterized protein n=1 Tax=Ectobacillus funiculus TaxID=137993 RepID=A0ABV5WN61_9BACI